MHRHFFPSAYDYARSGDRTADGALGHWRHADDHGIFGGHISGAHYNPAVSLAALLRGAPTLFDFLPYVAVQVAAAIAAAVTGKFITDGSVPIAPGPDVTLVSAFLVEMLFTFTLALTVLNVATAKGTAGNSFYGLAIGFVVVCAAFAGGRISGGAFNPAVGIGLSVGSLFTGTGGGMVWLYIVGPLIGGALAAVAFKLQGNENLDGYHCRKIEDQMRSS